MGGGAEENGAIQYGVLLSDRSREQQVLVISGLLHLRVHLCPVGFTSMSLYGQKRASSEAVCLSPARMVLGLSYVTSPFPGPFLHLLVRNQQPFPRRAIDGDRRSPHTLVMQATFMFLRSEAASDEGLCPRLELSILFFAKMWFRLSVLQPWDAVHQHSSR